MAKLDEIDGIKTTSMPCTLDKPTQSLVKLLFDNDMFKDAMKDLEIG
jgi:poly [ADP-ribose] polymerase